MRSFKFFPIENSLCQDTQMHEGKVSTALGLKASPNMAESYPTPTGFGIA